MAVYTFSTRTKKPEDTQIVEELKLKCDREGKNFSHLILNLLREYHASIEIPNSEPLTERRDS
jgi:hypothetical protein